MKVNVIAYASLGKVEGIDVPMGRSKTGGETRTSDGDFAAISTDARLIRVATDTTVYFKRDKAGASATNTDLLIPANTVEFFPVAGGETPTVTTA